MREGGEISVYYDPMIAKLVSYGDDRPTAVARLQRALDSFRIRGVSHNMGFLGAVLKHPRFQEGRLTTGFIDEEYADGFDPTSYTEGEWEHFSAVAVTMTVRERERELAITGQLGSYRSSLGTNWVVVSGEHRASYTIERLAGIDRITDADGNVCEVTTGWTPGESVFDGQINGEDVTVQVDRVGNGLLLHYRGVALPLLVMSPRTAELQALMPEKEAVDNSRFLLCPMPGLLISVSVEVGMEVKAGQELAVVEAMKMENVLRAERDATVASIAAKPGDTLAVDQPVLEFVVEA